METEPLFATAVLTTEARCAKAARAMNEARLCRRAHADARWSERALRLLGIALPYPKTRFMSPVHDEAAQLLLETRPKDAPARLVALLAIPLAPSHRILPVLGTLGDPAVVPALCDWFEAKDSAGARGEQARVWDALVAIGGEGVTAELERRLETKPLVRHHRWAYEQAVADVRGGVGRPNKVGFVVSP